MKRPTNRFSPTAIDLFSGCGGMTEGLKSSGFKVLAAVEIDELAASTYRLNHPRVRLWQKDIRRISANELMGALNLRKGQLDLLTGCPPCQGFSSMRRLNGGRRVRDERNDLLFDFLRLVRGLRPKTLMMENVPGLRDYWRWPKFLKTLESIGYRGEWRVLDAANYGVPQRRRRLLFVAGRGTEIKICTPTIARKTVRDAIAELPRPGKSGDPAHDLLSSYTARVKGIIRRIPRNGGSRSALGNAQLKCHKDFHGFKDVYGRMAWDTVAPTITGGCTNPSKGRFLHPTQNRGITLREAALLQTFPRDYKFSLARGKGPAALLIGNSLPPEFARQNLKPVLETLRKAALRR